ncbi:MAG: transporter substrate-binding domain-containing protein [Deltaproteobacteria bacterium]|uniref:Transporter substrate-binding domain-containing protein n=1 Tax=Candidatus Zymogenus saltonus TaxID=2844893 RepID=A0A9D8PM55_9DELT|nr:transporter substrate-binding domain-containing protein [Candidatus Zymogenus saltonus]
MKHVMNHQMNHQMNHEMNHDINRNRFKFFIALVLFFSLFSAPFAYAEETEAAKPIKVGWIMESKKMVGSQYNDLVFKALTALKDEKKIEIIRAPRLNLYVDETVKDLIKVGVTLIIASDEGGMAGAISDAAVSNPGVNFILIGAEGVPLVNLASVIFEEDEAGYMAGYAAGTVTKTGKVGFLGGAEFSPILRYERGFAAGVNDANPAAEVIVKYISEGRDSSVLFKEDAIMEESLRLSSRGADVLFAVSGPASMGAVYAAKKAGIYVVGLGGDRSDIAPNSAAASVVNRFDVAIKGLLSDALSGGFAGGVYLMGFENGGLDIVTSGIIGQDKSSRILNRKEQMKAGKVKVPDYMDERRKKILYVSHNPNMAPYQFIDEKGRSQGYIIDAMKEVGRRMGLDVKFNSFLGERTPSGLEAERSDIEAMLMLDRLRTRSFITTAPWGVSESVLVVPDKDTSPKAISDLFSKTVGVNAGGVEESYLQKIPGIFSKAYKGSGYALSGLALGEVDAVICDKEIAGYFINGPLSKYDLMIVEKPVIISPYAVGMAKPGDNIFLAQIDRTIKTMKEDGTLERLSEKWFGEKGLIKRIFQF